jgi:hypothetical protein
MILELTDTEAQTLRDLLRDYLAELKREVAHTDAKAFRHLLVVRQNLCERLLDELRRAIPAA